MCIKALPIAKPVSGRNSLKIVFQIHFFFLCFCSSSFMLPFEFMMVSEHLFFLLLLLETSDLVISLFWLVRQCENLWIRDWETFYDRFGLPVIFPKDKWYYLTNQIGALLKHISFTISLYAPCSSFWTMMPPFFDLSASMFMTNALWLMFKHGEMCLILWIRVLSAIRLVILS